MAVPTSMTTTQMIDAFLIEYDRIVSQVSQSYTDNEILSFLNRSQEQIIGELYQSRRFDLLGDLYVVSGAIAPTAATAFGIPNGYYIERTNGDFTRGVMFFVDVTITANRTGHPSGSETTIAEWIDRDLAKLYIKDLSNAQVMFRKPKAFVEGKYLFVLVDAFTDAPSASYVQYIKYPLALVASAPEGGVSTTTCELRADLHHTVVTKAVYLAKEATDRLQPQKQE